MHRDRCSCNHVPETSLPKTGTHIKSTPSIKRESPKGKRTNLKPRLQVPYSKVCTIILHMQEDQSPYRSIGTSCTMVLCVTLCRHINTNSLRELHLSTDQCTTLCKLIQAHPPHTPTDPQAKYKFVHSDLNKLIKPTLTSLFQ